MKILKRFPGLLLFLSIIFSINIGLLQERIKLFSTALITNAFPMSQYVDPLRISITSALLNLALILAAGALLYASALFFALKRPKRKRRRAANSVYSFEVRPSARQSAA